MVFQDQRGNRLPLRVPTPPRGEPIARYATYLEAQRAVDHLSDHQFPVQFVTIVGSGLRMVERVIGRRTYPRAALGGAASGAWFGLMVGTLYLLFGSGNSSAQLGTSIVLGAVFGMLFGVTTYGLTGGRRDFTSTSQIVASEYEVLCMPEYAGRARDLLHQLSWGQGADNRTTASPPPPPAAASSAQSTGTAQSGTAQSGTAASAGATPSAQPTGTEPAVPAEPGDQTLGVTGPTYSEMIAKQRRDREAAERGQTERGQTEREPGGGSESATGDSESSTASGSA